MENDDRDYVEWNNINFGILKREYEAAVQRGDEWLTLPDPVRTVKGERVGQLYVRYAKYLIEYLESLGLTPM